MANDLRQTLGPPLIRGRLYRYLLDYPRGCQGGIYRLVAFIDDVPAYVKKVLVYCVEGKDQGRLFCVSPQNFALRYELLEQLPQAPSQRVADFTSRGRY